MKPSSIKISLNLLVISIVLVLLNACLIIVSKIFINAGLIFLYFMPMLIQALVYYHVFYGHNIRLAYSILTLLSSFVLFVMKFANNKYLFLIQIFFFVINLSVCVLLYFPASNKWFADAYEKTKKKYNLTFLLLVIIVSIVATGINAEYLMNYDNTVKMPFNSITFKQGDSVAFYYELARIVKQQNKQKGSLVDSLTKFDSCVYIPDREVEYNYTLITYGRSEIDTTKFKELLQKRMLENLETGFPFNVFKLNDVRLTFKYFDKNNESLCSFTLNKDQY